MGVWTELVHRHSGRVRSAVSVSGPQRCTMAFQQQTQELARRLNRPVLTSVLETRIQAMTAHKFYGRSMIVHMDQIGVLNAQTVLIHGVWQTSSDLDILVLLPVKTLQKHRSRIPQSGGCEFVRGHAPERKQSNIPSDFSAEGGSSQVINWRRLSCCKN